MSWDPFDFGSVPPVEVAMPAPEDCPIFVVDDEPSILRTISGFLERKGYPVQAFERADDALEALKDGELALLITDISMPGTTGIELARRALEEAPDLAVVIFTGVPDSVTAVQSLRLGVSDYLTKPVDLDDLEDVVAKTLRRRATAVYRSKLEGWLREEVERRTREVQRVTVTTLTTLVRAMEAKDPYLKGDSQRVARLSERLARRLGMEADDVREVKVAGILHDIGFISTPDRILQKEGALTDEEFAEVKRHVETGVAILEPLKHLGRSIDYVRYHHERWNGKGYPEGLKGEEIPLGAQVVGLADAYVALTMERSFRPAHSPAEALLTLRATEDAWFQRRLLDALEAVLREGEKEG